MFREEWQLSRDDAPLARIAIVDEDPANQFLAPEFELFRQLFEDDGIRAVVADLSEFTFDGERLWCNGDVVDLVYNRLTDFSLDDPENSALREAYLAKAVVLTPHPHAHALYADKRNLAFLTEESWLKEIGVSESDRALLRAGIPSTETVSQEHSASFWTSRKKWFFKPAIGYGSKAAYRGDKLTKRVFEEIAKGGYIAQSFVPPSERRLLVDGVEQDLKLGPAQLCLSRRSSARLGAALSGTDDQFPYAGRRFRGGVFGRLSGLGNGLSAIVKNVVVAACGIDETDSIHGLIASDPMSSPQSNTDNVAHQPVEAEFLRQGIFVTDLDRPWIGTPFPLQGFLIENDEQIVQLQQLCRIVYVDRRRSIGDQLRRTCSRA